MNQKAMNPLSKNEPVDSGDIHILSENFFIPPKSRERIKSRLIRLRESSPYGSRLVMTFLKTMPPPSSPYRQGQMAVTLFLKSLKLTESVRAYGEEEEMELILDEVVSSMMVKINSWKKDRFEHPVQGRSRVL